jgi:RNA polymerase sigma-70 factor (ECF subfamily)
MLMLYLAAFESKEDREKFEDTYWKFKDVMLRVALLVSSGNHALAEDAVAEAFFQIIKDWDKFLGLPCNKWRSRIVIITKNKTIDLLRKEEKYAPPMDDDEIPGDDGDNVQMLLSHKEDIEYLARCIGKLPEIYRIPLQLRYHSELSNEEIAAVLKIPKTHVAVRIFRANALLRNIIDEEALNDE